MNSAQNIKIKLQSFIRSYHLQQLVQGVLSASIQSLVLFYLINYTEYLFWLNSGVRGILFYGFWILLAFGGYWQILQPLGKYLFFSSKRLSEEQAARIIGDHFEEISDKLLNLIQLERMGSSSTSQSPLLIKSIEQKTEQLKPFAFGEALNWPAVRKNIYRFSAVLFALIIWGVYDSKTISAASQRLVNYNRFFEKPAPFKFVLPFKDTLVKENADLTIGLTVVGGAFPEEVYLVRNGKSYLMKSESQTHYVYTLRNIVENTELQFEAAGYKSGNFKVNVIPQFDLENMVITAIFPPYLHKKPEDLSPVGSITLPVGTQLKWDLLSPNATSLKLKEQLIPEENSTSIKEKYRQISSDNKKNFKFHTLHLANVMIKLWSEGNGLASDTFTKQITVVRDAYPEIQIEQKADESNENGHYLIGNAIDDYGINEAYVEFELEEKTKEQKGKFALPITPGKSVVFSHVWDLKNMGVSPDKGLRFRVGVSDNDGVLGSKTSYSDWLYLRRWSDEKYENQINESQNKVEQQLAEAQSQVQKLQKQSQKLKQSMSVSSQLSFDMQEKVEDWLQKQEQQLERLSEIKKEQEQIDRQQNERAPKDEDLKERRKDLNERMKRLEDPKLQELMKELQELLSRKSPPQEIQRKMDQIDRRMQNQKEDMDQLLEQLKELRMEEQIDLQSQEMQKWIEKQQELIKQTESIEQKKSNTENKEKLQSDLLDQMKEQLQKAKQIQKRAEQIEEQNKKLQSPMNLDLGKPEIKEAQNQQNSAAQNSQQGKQSESKNQQSQAAEEMQEAMEKMQNSLEQSQKERNSEDLKSLRALLENLIEVSHRQEDIFTELSMLQSDNPRVLALNKEQMNIKNMSEGIEDSLRALAKRQPMVSDLVTREIGDINDNMDRAFEGLKVRNVRQAASFEQFVMTGYNNLAVMLMESLKNVQQRMNQQQKGSSKGSKMCQNPKPGNSGKSQKGKGSKLSEAQQQLGEKLRQMQKEGQQGEQKSQKTGEKGKQGQSNSEKKGDSKSSGKSSNPNGEGGEFSGERLSDRDWVEMVLMQEELRRKIEALRKEALKEGKTGQAANLFEAEKLMEEQEKKWVEKKFDAQMMWRQKQIETRLLEHEKAQLKQDQEDKRESKTATKTDLVVPPEWIEKQRKKVEEKEKLQRGAPQWQPYYRQKSEEYLKDISN